MIKVRGYRILVKPKEIEHMSKGGIITTVPGTQEDKLEKAGQQFGTVVGIGHTCWKGEELGEPWCELGDSILFSRHAGRFVYDPSNEEEALFIMNDTDVLAVVRENYNG